MYVKKPKLKEIILEKVAETGLGMIAAFFPKNYPEARLWRDMMGLDHDQEIPKYRVSNILSKLQKEGLVERSGSKLKSQWKITRKGLHSLETKDSEHLKLKNDGIQRLVIFDVSEKERYKRNRLRSELVVLGYEQLQKSVWIGECPLPTYFTQMIDDMDLAEAVHIFSVNKQGTL